MGVISGGSLCAGFNELPRGTNRQYNLLVIGDDYRTARVHVREMVEGEQFSSKRNGAFFGGYCDISWQPATDIAGRMIDVKANLDQEVVLKAESALRGGNPDVALTLLHRVPKPPASHAREIAVDAATRIKNWQVLSQLLETPCGTAEQVLFITALTQLGGLSAAETALSSFGEIEPALRKDLQEQISLKRMMSPQ